jgi:hypothetical protein
VTWNTLPWLKLLFRQLERLKPTANLKPIIWDSGSTDGTAEWLNVKGYPHYLAGRTSHADGLVGLLEKSKSKYVAFLDVDAVPIKPGWMDEAIDLLANESIGAVGNMARLPGEFHFSFVHPSFCVFRRDLYGTLGQSPHIVHDFKLGTAFDVGELMCRKMENEGYRLIYLGSNNLDPAQVNNWQNKVVHFGTATPVLAEERTDGPFLELVDAVVHWHKRLLTVFGLWDEFLDYCRESANRNPRCGRYLNVV